MRKNHGLKFRTLFFGLVLSLCATIQAQAYSGLNLQGTPISEAARRHGIDPLLVYAVALVESAKAQNKNQVRPWPWTLSSPDGGVYAASKQEATSALERLSKAHGKNVDVGLMQVNLRWHGHRVKEATDLLDMQTNLDVACAILAEAISSAPGDLALGIGRYHHWKDEQRARGYGQRVIGVWQKLQAL